MTRLARGVDRTATIVVGVALVVLGLLAVLWRLDVLLDLPAAANTDQILDILREPWWPWVVGAAGVALIVLGLRWLAAHLPSSKVRELNLPGSGDAGRLKFNASSAASAAAQRLSQLSSVKSATGKVSRDRGQLVVVVKATVDPAADLQELAHDADAVIEDLAMVMGRRDLHGRVHLKVNPAKRSRMSRVS